MAKNARVSKPKSHGSQGRPHPRPQHHMTRTKLSMGGHVLSGARMTPVAPEKAPPTLELYQREDCPFSHAVRTRISELGLDYVGHNVPDGNRAKHQLLIDAGGKDEIPFLIDKRTGVKLYESDAIIAYLDREYGHAENGRMTEFRKKLDTNIRNRADEFSWTLRNRIERAQSLRNRVKSIVRDSVETVKGSFRIIDEAIRKSVQDRRNS